MTRILRTSFLALLGAVPLSAQQPAAAAPQPAAATCSVDLNQPKELVTLYNISRLRAIQASPGPERAKIVKDIMKVLGTPKVAAANPQGTGLVAGQMLVIWMMQPGTKATATRGDLSWGEPANATIDLARTVDSLFTAVEKADPACLSETKIWREAKPWQDLINGSFKALQAGQMDSAEALVKASMILARTPPYAHRVLAAVAQSRGQQGEMFKELEAALALTTGDTLYAEDRRAVLFSVGQVGLEYAEIQPEPARTETLRKAVAAMTALATESPTADATPYALSGMGMAASSLKDSSLFARCFELVDKSLDKYNDLATLQAAVCANRNGKTADAVRMFQATLTKNPNSRDALYNAAALLYDLRKGSDMIPLVQRLMELDPSNPDNVSLFAYAYNVLHEQAKAAAEAAAVAAAAAAPPAAPKPAAKPGVKPAAPAPAPAPVPVVVKETWIDSVTKYMKLSDDMPQKVLMSEFTRYADKAILRGDIENRTKAAKTYTLEVEFLDITGAVLDKQSATVGPVDPTKLGTFTLTSNKPKVVAWRYAPLK
jgi:tetratricopeptide (TPR) repeat protein